MSKQICPQLNRYISALSVDEQAVDIMPEPNPGGQSIRLYANNALWRELVYITNDHWLRREHTQGTFYRQGRVLLNFAIWSRE
jgi:hypothetical protein